MKKALSLFGLVVLLSGLWGGDVLAQAASDAKLTKAMQLLQLTGTEATMHRMADAMLPAALQAQRAAHPEIPAAFWDEFATAFQEVSKEKTESLMQDIAQLYASEFSEAEMDAIIGFYGTDTGAKMIREIPILMQQSLQIGQRWGAAIGAEAAKRAVDNVRKKTPAP
jgi:hypothetical protein